MKTSDPVSLVTLAPGHFHAALVQKEAVAGVDAHVRVYAPLDPDLAIHVERIARFNSRANAPTHWTLDVHAGADWLERFQRERAGNVAIISGRNRLKIDLILAAIRSGYCVLADKPWIVEAGDFPKLEMALAEADERGVFALDIMTERWEATSLLQRELIGETEVLGEPLRGSADEPALHIESVHYLCKDVAGVPLCRPAWWYDPSVAGEGIADVGTHLADLAMWLLFPGSAIDRCQDIDLISASRWPTPIDRESFRENTGLTDFPAELAGLRDGSSLNYFGNGTVEYRLRDRFVRLTTKWGVKAEPGHGDTHHCSVRGSRSTVTVCHEPTLGNGPQVLVTPVESSDLEAIEKRIEAIASRLKYRVDRIGDRLWVRIPESARTGHEAHFAAVLGEFIGIFRDRARLPDWERSNLQAKYFVTTEAVRLAREFAARAAQSAHGSLPSHTS